MNNQVDYKNSFKEIQHKILALSQSMIKLGELKETSQSQAEKDEYSQQIKTIKRRIRELELALEAETQNHSYEELDKLPFLKSFQPGEEYLPKNKTPSWVFTLKFPFITTKYRYFLSKYGYVNRKGFQYD
jgi:hypothetical protein